MAVVWIGERDGGDAAIVGGKAAALGRLVLGGEATVGGRPSVPPGFTIRPGPIDRAGLAAAYRELGALCGRADPEVAVRSSALEEDGAGASFAGQYESVLGVRGLDAVLAAVARCRASGSTLRVRAYREARGLGVGEEPAVLVQLLVSADVAVVAFSADPVTGDRERVLITAASGPVDRLAAGAVTPDGYTVDRRTGRIIARGGPALDDARTREVAALVLALERSTGAPVDVECAYAEGTLHLLQCRPVTTPIVDRGTFWVQERMHHPEPVGALEFALIGALTAAGMNAAAHRLGVPIAVRMQHVGGYVYQATTPVPGDDPQDRLLAAADRLAADWRRLHLPEIRGHLAAWDEADLAGAPAATLLDDTLDRLRRLGELHFLIAFPGLAATSALVDLHAELFPEDGLLAAHDMLRGLLRPTLDAYAGQRGPVAPPPADRERLIARSQARLRDRPPALAIHFERLLSAAEAWAVLSEEHAHWIDVRCMERARAVVLALGERLVATGALEQAADVLLLEPDELRTLAAGDGRRATALVARRRAELRRAQAVTPPPTLGSPPEGPPPDTPLLRAIGRYLGPPAPTAADAATVRGHPGAAGRARGPARVVHRLADAGRVQLGDVLVAPTTAPEWTPLFTRVAAVVTDTGGVLCHGATVAREYGIPAVVGAAGATARIRDGQPVEVDGAAGVVRLLRDSGRPERATEDSDA